MGLEMLSLASPLLKNVFGSDAKDILDIVEEFYTEDMNVREVLKQQTLHQKLAPSLGNLSKNGLQEMDDEMKIMMAGTLKILGVQEQLTWETAVTTMMKNELVEIDGEEIFRTKQMIKTSDSEFKFSGDPDPNIVKEVQGWFTELISDSDVIQGSGINIDVLAKIVAQSGATVDSFGSFFAKRERHEKTIIDIGVLRFPDIEHPYFKLYRIKLDAWSDCRRILAHQTDTNGITGVYNSRNFKPRRSMIEQLTASSRKKALASIESLFDN